MICRKRIFSLLVLTIFLINPLATLIPIQEEGFLDSDELIAQILRGLGLRKQKKENFFTVQALRNNSILNSQNIDPFRIHSKQSEYSIPGWADTRWKYRKNITIDSTKVSSNLNNFPVLIDLYDVDLQKQAQASGNDICLLMPQDQF